MPPRGMALVSVLFLLSMLGMLASVAITRTLSLVHLEKRNVVLGQAEMTAYGGLSLALEELKLDPLWGGVVDGTLPALPGRVTVKVFDNSASLTSTVSADGVTVPPGTYLVKAVGNSGESAPSTMYGILEAGVGGKYSRAVTTDKAMVIEGGTVDAFDSSVAPVGTANRVAGAAPIGAAEAISVLKANGVAGLVDGKVSNHLDQASGLTVDAASTVTGAYNQLSTPLNPSRSMPAVAFTSGPWIGPSGNETVELAPGQYKGVLAKDDVTIRLVANGDYFIQNGIEFWGKSRLEVAPGVTARVFTEGPILVYDEAQVNTGGKPSQLELLSYSDSGGGPYYNFSGGEESNNFRIGPDAQVAAAVSGDTLHGKVTGQLWGAFSGSSMWVYNYGTVGTAAVHYDVKLDGSSVGPSSKYLSVWKAH